MVWNEAWRDDWEKAGYSRHGGSVCIMPPPPADVLRVYHLTSADYAVSNIALGRLKVARFSDLNDPFELMALNFRESRARKIVRDFKSTKDSTMGLLCFSANWTNPVLWSHYGAKHSGICLGFDLSRSFGPQRVEYESDRIQATLDANDKNPNLIPPDLQDGLLRTKYKDWHYEEEIRMFLDLSDLVREERLHFFPFDRGLDLAEVILGPRCALSLDAVSALVQDLYPRAMTFQSRLAFKFFSVVPKESTVPDYKLLGQS